LSQKLIEALALRQSYKTTLFSPSFLRCLLFTIKLDPFKVQTIFSCATNTQAYQQKSEKRRNQSLVGLTPGLISPKIFTSKKPPAHSHWGTICHSIYQYPKSQICQICVLFANCHSPKGIKCFEQK
jgi:hypothetical protein